MNRVLLVVAIVGLAVAQPVAFLAGVAFGACICVRVAVAVVACGE